ncbi:hypothetical protein P691DRAFT_678874 [Macrolepiota fuliginosa MF-IS2]|uniref:Uncharacterized protein n=1 Tax=Macrolepiota fuliginosa MF-IS2 TaxID=1400762 RepID=A0A9P5X513_9AGAR|nr:hypothetical protein P691DRAFT_678874 [Macrolepiota fuliginosa MF-IS2]
MGDTPLDQEVAVVFTAALAFGLYFSTFLSCCRWLLFSDEGWRVRRDIKWPTVTVTVLIFGCNIIYLSWALHWTMVRTFHVANSPEIPYETPEWAGIVSCTVGITEVLLADIVVIYRCWTVYERQVSIIMAPVFLWLAGFVCNILQIYLQSAHIKNPNIGPYAWGSVTMNAGPGIVLVPFWISTILLNAYVSVALIWRIYRTAQECKFSAPVEHLHFFIRVISESGFLYFTVTTAHFVSWFGKSLFATDIMSALNAAVLGIAFDWFLIRVAMSNAAEAAKEGTRASEKGCISTMEFGGSSASEFLSDDGTAVIM